MDEGPPTRDYLQPSLVDPPGSLHPKQHVQVVYFIGHWNGQPITKMFLHNMGGTEDNDAGYRYIRLSIPKGYVKVLEPVPTPQPTGE